jgi:hypothetical protein
MAPLTETEVKQQLLECIVQKTKMYTYTDLVGFRKLSHSKSRSGPQVYKGVVGAFYKLATSTLVHALAKEYRSLAQLHNTINAQAYFTHDGIEDCLTKYGSKIWSDGLETPFVTHTDTEEENETSYSCRLIYKNEADFTR